MNAKLTEAQQDQLAERIYHAIQAGQGIDPPSETVDYNFADAYQIRRKLVDRLIADGGKPCGHKIGFTSEAMQKMYGMTGPDFGILLDNMLVPAGEPVRVSDLSNTRIEPEFAFELGEPLLGPGVTVEQVLASTARIWAAVEVIDSRVGAMRAGATDSIADNAGAGKLILGTVALGPDDFDLINTRIGVTVDGENQSGISGDVMGHPAAPVAWLANKLSEIGDLGERIKAGDIVISGSSTKSMAVAAGSKLHATFGPLGTIDIEFE